MARPKLEISKDQVLELAKIMCTQQEMAAVLGCSVDTLQRRFAAVIKEGHEHGKMSLRRKLFEIAMGGHAVMCIWLSKQHLGMRDQPLEDALNKQPMKLAYNLDECPRE